jgi:hypothetical protein
MTASRLAPLSLIVLLGCGGDASTAAGTVQSDTGRTGRDTSDDDAPVRPRPDTGEDDDGGAQGDAPSDTGAGADAVVDEPFVRPRPDTTPDDADVGDEVVDEPDTIEVDAATDAPDDPSFTLEGTTGCLFYRIRVTDTVFVYKGDDIALTYFVQNICATPFPTRVAHTSDFFPIAIEKDGEPWVFLPDCPGTGAPFENTFETTEGINRGWTWGAADHEARVARCGVTFDPAATYRIVGYGASEVDPLDSSDFSVIAPMTPPIDIVLRP